MQTMYPGMPNSPQTELASAIDDEQTTIPLLDASVLPDPPNICTIGIGEDAETILYTGKSGNNLTGVTRGFQGAAKAWVQGTKVARNFTAYDYDALRENLEDHAAATTGVHGATSAATPNTIIQRDPSGRAKVATPNAPDDIARKAEVDAAKTALQTQIDSLAGDIGDKSQLQTNDKSNLVAAVNELFTSVGSGKEMLAAAITDKGVPTSPTDTFATMAANIGAIETGGPWFGDWGAYTPVYDISGTTQNVPAKSWHTFVDVSGVGFFKWCRGFNTTVISPQIRITIDGVEKIFDFTGGLGYVGNEVNVEIPFFESLKIEVYNSSSSTSGIGCDYLYFLRNTSPDPNVSTILQQSVLAGVLSNVASSSLVDVANLTGSGYLLGIRSWGYGSVGVVYLDVDIDGSKKMNDRQVWNISAGPYKFDRIIGPIRFNSSLRVRTRGTGGTQLIIVDYSLD